MNKETKNILIIFSLIVVPILFALISFAIKDGSSAKKEITKNTYVHVFYVDKTDALDKVKASLDNMEGNFKPVYYNISDEQSIYAKVLDYFKIEPKVYNPLIIVDDTILTEYDNESLQKVIKDSNKTYNKDNLTKDEILKYNIVDRLNAGEEVPEK